MRRSTTYDCRRTSRRDCLRRGGDVASQWTSRTSVTERDGRVTNVTAQVVKQHERHARYQCQRRDVREHKERDDDAPALLLGVLDTAVLVRLVRLVVLYLPPARRSTCTARCR